MSVCSSARVEQLGYHWIYLYKIWYLRIFQKSFGKIKVSLKMTGIKGTLHEGQYTFLIYLAHFFLEWEMSKSKHILCSITFFNHAVYKKKKKNVVQPDKKQITIWRMCIARDTWGYKHKHRMFNIYCFSTATMVTRTRLNVTLCVHSLSCLYWFLGSVILEIIRNVPPKPFEIG
jgi:hypothetical protein